MKLSDIMEQGKELLNISVSGGDYLTRGGIPSVGTKNNLKKLIKHLEKGFLKKFKGSISGKTINSQTLEFNIGITFESNQDRIDAIKYLRKNLNTDYIRNVKSY